MRPARCLAAGIAVGTCLYALCGVAGRPTMEECFEGSDFIGNVALSRDAGVAPAAFLGRMQDDFAAIRAFPSDLRWFVHDADDEAFLLSSAREVFDHPDVPQQHRVAFLRSCIKRMSGVVTPAIAPTVQAPVLMRRGAAAPEPMPLDAWQAASGPAR